VTGRPGITPRPGTPPPALAGKLSDEQLLAQTRSAWRPGTSLIKVARGRLLGGVQPDSDRDDQPGQPTEDVASTALRMFVLHSSACRTKALGSSGPVVIEAGLLLCRACLGSQPGLGCYALRRWAWSLRRLWAVAASSHSLLQAPKPAAGHGGYLLAGLDLAEHRFDGLGAELVTGAATVVAHPPGGSRGGRQLGQVTAPGGIADAAGGGGRWSAGPAAVVSAVRRGRSSPR
jgi:hypothetical protein